ncbi:MAG TPA: hypothetical protein VK152_13665 [Paludibacter sp.]|nr:hypothetical protein [Paludibacter sp.]
MVIDRLQTGCWLGLLLLVSGCIGCSQRIDEKHLHISDKSFRGTVTFQWLDKNGWYTVDLYDSASLHFDRIIIPYDIYDIQTGDINRDGHTDICVGLIKPTPFDPVMRKRLFIFRIDRGYLRPLWLGSRLAYSFERFKVVETASGCVVRTLEKKKEGKWSVSEYRWQCFGLSFVGRTARLMTHKEAEKLLEAAH